MEIPLNHYLHLKRLAALRRCTVEAAVEYLFSAVDRQSLDWLDEHFGPSEGVRRISSGRWTAEQVAERVQGLPRNIRPVTDGPYLGGFEFFHGPVGLLGISAEGVRVLDFETSTARDAGVFPLVRDLLPPMTVEQYRLYNTFNSQYLRLVREPLLFTMPRAPRVAVDAGAYVGYKALAMAQFVKGAEVVAIEMIGENYEVLEHNARLNAGLGVHPLRAALSSARGRAEIETLRERTMAHSLAAFKSLKEGARPLDRAAEGTNRRVREVNTVLLDDVTREHETLSAVHVSVNGHEPEVTEGGLATLKKADIIRISCPYSREGQPVFGHVVRILEKNGVQVFGRSGGAVVAGRELGDYHAIPLVSDERAP